MTVNKKRRTYWLSHQNIEILGVLTDIDKDNRTTTGILEGLIQKEAKKVSRQNTGIANILKKTPREYIL